MAARYLSLRALGSGRFASRKINRRKGREILVPKALPSEDAHSHPFLATNYTNTSGQSDRGRGATMTGGRSATGSHLGDRKGPSNAVKCRVFPAWPILQWTLVAKCALRDKNMVIFLRCAAQKFIILLLADSARTAGRKARERRPLSWDPFWWARLSLCYASACRCGKYQSIGA